MKRLLATIPALLLSACGFAVVAPAVDALVNEQGEPYADLLAALSPILHEAPALRDAATIELSPLGREIDAHLRRIGEFAPEIEMSPARIDELALAAVKCTPIQPQ